MKRDSSIHDDDDILSDRKSRTNSEKSLTHSFSSSEYEDTTNNEATVAEEKPKFGAKLRVVLCILFCEMCERLVYYGISGNLLLFLKSEPMSLNSADASSFVLVFTGKYSIMFYFSLIATEHQWDITIEIYFRDFVF